MKTQHAPFRFEGIFLRPLVADDIETTRRWRNRDDVRCWFKNSAPIASEQQQHWYQAYADRDDDYVWVVEDAGNRDRAVGQIALYSIDRSNGEAEIGRLIAAPDARRAGYMTTAFRAALYYGFVILDLRLVRLEVLRTNAAALSIYRKCGFNETGNTDELVSMGLARTDWAHH